MKRLVFLVVSVLVLAACGGGGGGGSSSGNDKAQITQVWNQFFSSKVPASKKPAMVENGSKFATAINAIAQNPLAANTDAKVSSVTLEGANTAKVVYSVYVSGSPVLKNQTGEALKENGKWVVADVSFCSLLKLEGNAPNICQKS